MKINILFTILLTAIFFRCSTKSDTPDRKPNVILIMTDDQGYGDLSCFGGTHVDTPRIDQMAAEGIRFTNFYAQTVCGPSRAALMTGCYPLRLAIEKNRVEIHPHLHTHEITIAEVLKEQGYIKDFKFLENETQGVIRVYVKYVSEGNPTIFGIERVSKPSCRVYSKSKNIKPVLNGLGISIISTSKGLMTDKQAKEANVGGEILCNVW